MSVALPLTGPVQPAIDHSYRLWVGILDAALRDAYGIAVDAAPVEGAFCTGGYDVAAHGRKLAGVAQARRIRSVVIHGTILVNVEPVEYSTVVASADRLLGISAANAPYNPSRIVSLHELVGRSIPLEELARAIGRVANMRRGHAPRAWQQVSAFEVARAQRIAKQHADQRRTGGLRCPT